LRQEIKSISVVRPRLLYISSEAVIPAPYLVVGSNRQVRGKLQRESTQKYWIPPYQVRGRLSQARMTIKVKGFLTKYISL